MSREQLKTRVMEEIDRRLPEFKDLLRDVVRIPTDNPPGEPQLVSVFPVGARQAATIGVGPSNRNRPSSPQEPVWCHCAA